MILKKVLTLVSFYLLLASCINSTNGQEYDIQEYINLLKNNRTYENFYLPHLQNYIHFIDLVLNDIHRNVSLDCENDFNHLKRGFLNKSEFALNFYEANSVHKTGIFTGSDGHLGNFDQCLSIAISTNGSNYKGKYCLISIQTALSNSIKKQKVYEDNLIGLSEESKLDVELNLGTVYGICIPSSCNIQNLLNSVNKETKKYGISVVGQHDHYCSSNDSSHNNEPFKLLEMISLAIVSIFVLLCLLASFYENKFLNLFSIKKNFKKIYRVPDDYEENEYNFIHGFKAIYLLLSAAFHAAGVLYIFAPFLYATLRGYQDTNPIFKGILKRLLIGPDIAIFIGGFLAIIAWKAVFALKRSNFFLYVIARFMRTIPIIISMLLLDRIWPRFSTGSGPFYRQITDHIQKNCDRSFWKLFLFVSNQDRALDLCQVPSWFISVDFQLYIAHYWTIKYLIQKPKIGLSLAFLQMFCMIVYSAQDIFFNNLEPYFNAFNVHFYDSIRFEKQYFITSIHSNSYTMGVLAGWLVLNRKKVSLFETKMNRFIGFIISCACVGLAVFLPDLFGDHNYLPENNLPASIGLSIWGSVYRILYMMIFLCLFYFMTIGYFKYGKKIFSQPIMLHLSRLSFTIIMSQFMYLWYNIGVRKSHFLLTPIDLLKEAFFSLVVSLVIGNLVFAFLEAPITNLLFKLTGMDKKKARLKQDCSTARLSGEIEEQIDQEQMLKNQANQLFKPNKSFKTAPSFNVILFDENQNENQKFKKPIFEC